MICKGICKDGFLFRRDDNILTDSKSDLDVHIDLNDFAPRESVGKQFIIDWISIDFLYSSYLGDNIYMKILAIREHLINLNIIWLSITPSSSVWFLPNFGPNQTVEAVLEHKKDFFCLRTKRTLILFLSQCLSCRTDRHDRHCSQQGPMWEARK